MFNTEREIRDAKIRLCLDCGKCTVVCPVAQHDPEFNPRRIVQRKLGQGGCGLQDESIWQCLNCYMCVEYCNYKVKFPELIRTLRWEAFTEGAPVQCSHGGTLQTLMRMMTQTRMEQKRLDWLAPYIELSEQYQTLFFVGCAPYFDVLFSHLEVNTIGGVNGALKLLNHAQIPFNLLANERCCGRDLLLQGDREGFMALAQANMDEFSRHNIKRIITSCPECYYTLKVDYTSILGNTGIEVLHLTEVIAPLVRSGELNLGKLEEKVTFHDSCVLGRCARIFDEPRQILSGVTGLELSEMEQSHEKALCCGASSWVHCGTVHQQIQEQRLAQAEATGAHILVTTCPKCQIHLKCAQKGSAGQVSQIEIQDMASLVARSLD